MKIIISPAKKMNAQTDLLEIRGLPVFLAEAEYLTGRMQSLSRTEAKALWKCNDKLADLNFERFRMMNLYTGLTPALLSYEGLQYQHIAPFVLDTAQWEYVQQHLYILSGLYGLVRPFDGVTPYRLEMQARLVTEHGKNLYEFWGRRLYDRIAGETDTIINLASKEYSKTIAPYAGGSCRMITCVFGQYRDGKIIEKGTIAKMARGEMVRYMAEHNIKHPEQLKTFNRIGFCFARDLSDEATYVFLEDAKQV